MNSLTERLAYLYYLFPNLKNESKILSNLSDDTFLKDFMDEQFKINDNIKTKPKNQKLMANSEDEEKELAEALKVYRQKSENTRNRQNTKKNKVESIQKENKKSKQPNYCKEQKSNRGKSAQAFGEKTLSNYEKQGAIPKTKFNSYFKERGDWKQGKSGNNRFKELKCTNENQDSENIEIKIMTCEPFFYVVPDNPAPGFFFPKGSYYVIPKAPDLPGVRVFHHPPLKFSSDNFFVTSRDPRFSNLNKAHKPPMNGLNDLDSTVRMSDSLYNNLNISDNKYDQNAVLTTNWQDITYIKSPVEGEIKKLNSTLPESAKVLDDSNASEFSYNLNPNSSKFKKIYKEKFNSLDKPYNIMPTMSHASLMSLLFPSADQKYLSQKVEECHGDYELLKLFVEAECQRLMTEPEPSLKFNEHFNILVAELPGENLKRLFEIWVTNVGNKERILEIIKNEKTQKKLEEMHQLLIKEFPEMSEEMAGNIALEYLDNQKGFENFLAAEHSLIKKQGQLKRIIELFPNKNVMELSEKIEEFQGNEDLLQAYIDAEAKLVNWVDAMQVILPDADTTFLLEEAKKLEGNDEKLNIFMNELLESEGYPKISFDKNTQQKKNLWKTYVDNFNVGEYLLKVRDPEKFMDRQHNCLEDEKNDDNSADLVAVTGFLKSRYPEVSEMELKKVFKSNDQNLTKTCKELDESEDWISLALTDFHTNDFDEDFLQEITHIDHRAEIDEHILAIKTRQVIEEEEARLGDAFLMCPLCYNNHLIPLNTVTCPEGHVFCTECIHRYVEIKFGDSVYKYSCPLEDCDTFFTSDILQKLLPETLYRKIIRKQQAAEVINAELEGLESCLFCEFSYIPNPTDKIFKCLNPECLMETCRDCQEPNHIPLRCEEVERPKDLKARKKVEEAMTNKLIRICPGCGKKFVKLDGCNKMVCVCGTIMCYICRQKIDGYSHFKGHSKENPNATCELHSNNKKLHEEDVAQEGLQTLDSLLKEDPSLRVPLKNDNQ